MESSVFAAEGKWFEQNRLVAHALGSIGDKKETNSKEAFLDSWSRGYRVVEADFAMTSDGTVVVRHDFEQDSYYQLEQKVNGPTQMSSTRYVNEKINFRYTPLTAKQLFELLMEYDDMYLITDSKSTDAESITKEFTAIVNTAKALGQESLLNRFVVQIYNDEMYHTVKNIYPFQNWIYTLYQVPNPDYNVIGDFCVQNGIDVVTINYEVVTPQNVKLLNDKGIKVYAHTVNRMLDFQRLLSYGVYGIYTDYIKPYDLGLAGLKTPSSAVPYTVTVNGGEKKTIHAHTIIGEDYMRLRDIAMLVSGTKAQFAVNYNATANILELIPGEAFRSMGNEMLIDKSGLEFTQKSPFPLTYHGEPLHLQGYSVDGDLYYKLSDMAKVLNVTIEQEAGSNSIALTAELLEQPVEETQEDENGGNKKGK